MNRTVLLHYMLVYGREGHTAMSEKERERDDPLIRYSMVRLLQPYQQLSFPAGSGSS